MLIKWQEKDMYGNDVVKERYDINIRNTHTYAKRNCRKCHGRGYENYNNGWYTYLQKDENNRIHVMRQEINPRVYVCDCVARTLNKLK